MQNLTEIEAAIDEYLIAIRQAGYSQTTREKYSWHLRRMYDWLHRREITQLKQLNRKLLREWGADLYDYVSPRTRKPWSPAMIKQAVASVRSFFVWCFDEQILHENLAKVLIMPKVEKSPQRTLDIKEAWMTIQSCDPSTNKGVRDRAIVALLIDSGLRASELCRLRIDDISFGIEVSDPFLGTLVEISQTTVLRKGGKKEPAYFGPITTRWIRTWLQIRDNVAKNGVEELFVSIGGTKPGTALTRDGLRVIIRNLAQQAGVKHFSPHALRRSFACLLNEAGASTRNIQLFGGWSNIREVETYTQAVEISRQYARYNPVGFLNKVAEQEKLRQKNTGFD